MMDETTRERFDRWDTYWAGEQAGELHDAIWAIWEEAGELMHSRQTKHFDALTQRLDELIGGPSAEGEKFWREMLGH